ncbi:MAG TPA: transposase [Candidatus Omnitrophota bacterium]|nr:transposase [Candidatus Omnitrophota bacterium]
MPQRKVPLVTGCFYHVFARSIAGFEIFRYPDEFLRMIETLRFYKSAHPKTSFSKSQRPSLLDDKNDKRNSQSDERIEIIAYCVMPTHLHLLLAQVTQRGISDFMRLVLHSYSRYFNLKIRRKGTLWESRFQYVLVNNDAQALHLSRYIHINPCSAGLVSSPSDWEYSSYREYIQKNQGEDLCHFDHVFSIVPRAYEKFVAEHQDTQRELQIIKSCLVD